MGRGSKRAGTCRGGRAHVHLGPVVRLWGLGHRPEGTVSTVENEAEAQVPGSPQHMQSAPGPGLLPRLPSPLSTSRSKALPSPLAVPHAPLPAIPPLRTTSWRRSHQVPSVS